MAHFANYGAGSFGTVSMYIWHDESLDTKAKISYLALSTKADHTTGHVEISRDRLAKMTGLSLKSITDAIKQLEANGWLHKEVASVYERGANRYKIFVKKLDDPGYPRQQKPTLLPEKRRAIVIVRDTQAEAIRREELQAEFDAHCRAASIGNSLEPAISLEEDSEELARWRGEQREENMRKMLTQMASDRFKRMPQNRQVYFQKLAHELGVNIGSGASPITQFDPIPTSHRG